MSACVRDVGQLYLHVTQGYCDYVSVEEKRYVDDCGNQWLVSRDDKSGRQQNEDRERQVMKVLPTHGSSRVVSHTRQVRAGLFGRQMQSNVMQCSVDHSEDMIGRINSAVIRVGADQSANSCGLSPVVDSNIDWALISQSLWRRSLITGLIPKWFRVNAYRSKQKHWIIWAMTQSMFYPKANRYSYKTCW